MRPILWFAIQKAKRYRKKHDLPDRYEITGEEVEKARKRGAEQDYDCTTVKAKFLKGLTLEKVELPDGLTEIGDYAFKGSGIRKIHIPDSVVRIGTGAFEDCQKLDTVNLPPEIT